MTKNILSVIASPRKDSNSAFIARTMAQAAENLGATIEEINLNDYNIKPCIACEQCKTKKELHCVLKDEMYMIYEKLLKADAFILSSPIYWFTVSAQLKLFMDRCYALIDESKNCFKGKKIAFALTYADDDSFSSGCVNALHTLKDTYSYLRSDIVGMVHGSAWKEGDIAGSERILKKAQLIGEKLI